jgi:hypothetical protein
MAPMVNNLLKQGHDVSVGIDFYPGKPDMCKAVHAIASTCTTPLYMDGVL